MGPQCCECRSKSPLFELLTEKSSPVLPGVLMEDSWPHAAAVGPKPVSIHLQKTSPSVPCCSHTTCILLGAKGTKEPSSSQKIAFREPSPLHRRCQAEFAPSARELKPTMSDVTL